MQLKRNGKQVDNDSLLFTQYKSSLPFIAQADANYKKQQEQQKPAPAPAPAAPAPAPAPAAAPIPMAVPESVR